MLLAGVEQVAITTDPSSPVPLIFTEYPVSHSLLTTLAWALLFCVIYFLFKRNAKGSIMICFLVLSHWLLDLLVHVPDLPLTPFTEYKVGLGLWRHKYLELGTELLMFAIGVYMYVSSTTAKNKTGSIALWALVIFLVTVQFINVFGPPPADAEPVVYMATSQWLLVLWAYWADMNRKIAYKWH